MRSSEASILDCAVPQTASTIYSKAICLRTSGPEFESPPNAESLFLAKALLFCNLHLCKVKLVRLHIHPRPAECYALHAQTEPLFSGIFSSQLMAPPEPSTRCQGNP